MKAPRPLLLVAQKLGPLRDRMVFVGGMIRGLLTTDPAAGPMRPTDDVDLIVRDVDSLAAYHALGAELRRLGFHEDSREGAPLCRWVVADVTTDIMPINPAALGFSNVWYESAQRHTATTNSEQGPLHHLDAPHFCATKLEAFASRAAGDYYHHDIEDFVALVDERPTLVDEIARAPSEVCAFIFERTRALLDSSEFRDALAGHLLGDSVSQQRLPGLIAKLERIAALHEARTRTRGALVQQAERPALRAFSPQLGRVYVQSSNLDWVEYDPTQKRLSIGFLQGGAYSYSGVPAAVHKGLLDAYSKGRYFHVWIRDRYPNRRLR